MMDKISIAKDLFTKMAKADRSALQYLSDDFTLVGPMPEPINKNQWFGMISGMVKAFDNFSYNPEGFTELENGDLEFTLQVTGKHTDELSIPNGPTIPATNIAVKNPRERIVLSFKEDKVSNANLQNTQGGGVPGILKQLGVSLK